MSAAPDPAAALARVMRMDRGRILSALIARTGDFQLAEDALGDAGEAALIHWQRSGIPDNPMAWLIRVAFRKAIDRLRRRKRDDREVAALALLARDEAEEEPEMIADERLRLIFTCCHPALEPKSRVALTLRSIAGLSTAEIARAFLDNDATMGQRLSRAKAKIQSARIPFAVPEPEDWADRLQSVLAVIYLIFNAGYTSGPQPGRDLCDEAIYLARMLNQLRPGEPEVEGALALMRITHARQKARVDGQGASIALSDQDRGLWDHVAIAEGLALIETAMGRHKPGPYQIKAAIAACNVQGVAPDWPQIAALYDSLLWMEPTPVVRLNRAVAHAEAGSGQALELLLALGPELDDYQPYHASRAEFLARAGRVAESRVAYDRAIALAASSPDAAYLRKKRDALPL